MRYLWQIWISAKIGAKTLWQGLKIRCSRTRIARSGGLTKRCGYVSAYGESRFYTLAFADGKLPYTLDELEAMTIQCAWCEKPIFIGDLVTIAAAKGIHAAPAGAVVISVHPTKYVGCVRATCCELPIDAQGQWVPDDSRPGKGKVALLAMPFGMEAPEEPPDALMVPA